MDQLALSRRPARGCRDGPRDGRRGLCQDTATTWPTAAASGWPKTCSTASISIRNATPHTPKPSARASAATSTRSWARAGRTSSHSAASCRRTRRAPHSKSLWRYNFTPDVGTYRKQFTSGPLVCHAGRGRACSCAPSRKAAMVEAGGGKIGQGFAGYFNECMNGFEYQAAGHMIAEGMVQEGLGRHPRRSTTATTPRAATPTTKSNAATTTPARWPATECSSASADSNATDRRNTSASRRRSRRKTSRPRSSPPKAGAVSPNASKTAS